MITHNYQKRKCVACIRCKTSKREIESFGEVPATLLFIDDMPSRTDEIIGFPMAGVHGRILSQLATGFTFHVCTMVQCVGHPSILPTEEEILQCKQRVLDVYKKVNPDVVVFMSKLTERFYKKDFSVHCTIVHPAILNRLGVQRSPLFTNNINTIRRAVFNAQKEAI